MSASIASAASAPALRQALEIVSGAQSEIDDTLTDVRVAPAEAAPPEQTALWSAMTAIGHLGEGLATAHAVENATDSDALAGTIYGARTSLMLTQTQLMLGVQALVSGGLAGAQPRFAAARSDVGDAVAQLRAAVDLLPAAG